MSIIHVQDVTKIYRIVEKDTGIAGSFRALFRPHYKDILAIDLHFSIGPGEFIGYIGVTGAGKSTTIKMLTGILVPSAGDAADSVRFRFVLSGQPTPGA